MKKKIMVLGMSSQIGGVESYIMNWFRNIDRNTFKCYFLYTNGIAYQDELTALGGNLIRIEVSRHRPFEYVIYVRELFRKYKFDVIYYNTCDIMSMDMILFGKKYGVPVRIIHTHSSSNIVKPNFLHRCTEKWCRKHLEQYATKLLACSEAAGQWMFENKTFEIVKNGIDVRKYSYSQRIGEEIRDQLGIHNKLVIGFVGRLGEEKNPVFLVDIFAKIKEKMSDAVLMIIGTGDLRNNMEQRAKESGVYDSIYFLGVRTDVCKLMSAMDRLLLPSKFEGFPFVLVEAQANGLPCITSTNVSEESNITSEVKYIPLEADLEKWADIVLHHKLKLKREEYADIVQSKGFDIMTTVDVLEKYFEGA